MCQLNAKLRAKFASVNAPLSTSVEMPEGSFTRPISEADFALS